MTRTSWLILSLIVMILAIGALVSCAVLTSEYAQTSYPDALQQSENYDVGGPLGLNSAYPCFLSVKSIF